MEKTPILVRNSARMVTRLGPQSDIARVIAAVAIIAAYIAGFIPLYHLAGTDVLDLDAVPVSVPASAPPKAATSA